MDHIVAVAVELEDGAERFYLTWGRIQDKVDAEPLEQLVLRYCVGDDLGGKPVRARVCRSLQEAAHAPYFYEGFFSFCQEHIPFGEQYEAWSKQMNDRMQAGEELYYLGNPDRLLKKKGP
ncbi:MAG TPA: hypothetical protein VKX46_14745 [Ktedonobacteraceae bacterium]|nr:hypothetical protein [Ktedonobacteraceae bacterium]